MRDVTVALEPWSRALYSEMRRHAEAHFAEVDAGIEGAYRRYRLDLDLMQQLADAGVLIVIIARRAEQLVGYFTWNILPDVESVGLLIAQQGGLYAAPGHARCAVQMWDLAIAELKARGVDVAYPHHRTRGRGANIGRFFKRRGAKLIQHTYSLKIGD